MVCLLGRDDRGIGHQREVDTRVGHQVGLELSQVYVEGTIETQGSGDARDNLANKTVQVGVGGTLNVEITAADIVDGFVVNHESAVRVLEGGVGDLRSGVDGELKLALLSVVHRQTFHQQRGEARASATTKGVEDEESLKACALVSKLADTVEHQVNDFLANGVVATSVVVGSILLAGDQLLRVEELAVGSSAHLICGAEFQGVVIILYVPTTVGSKSTNTARGTCFPAPVSLKKVLKLSSPPPTVLSDGI
ncbi:hypothetical protein B566_EDAN014105 [Ephemera danica]|nr:hypothetical protein B566_EDAN014105 [Ephemera danica]